ncbi:MAG: SPOR domain-containing protein [Pseudomonadota bacterium]
MPISGEVPGAEAAPGATDLDTAGLDGANLDGAGLDTVETSSLDTPETIETTALEAFNEESASVAEANAETFAEPGAVNPVLDITAADLPPVDNGSFELARAALEAAGALPPPGFDIPLGAVATTALPDPAPVETASLEQNPSPAPLVTPLPAPKPERDLTSVVPTAAPAPEDTAPKPVISGAGSSLDEPFIQIGLFSVEANAQRSGDRLRNEGILPVVVKDEVNGTTYWRVLAGPSPNEAERETLLAKVQALGYAGAYFVTN